MRGRKYNLLRRSSRKLEPGAGVAAPCHPGWRRAKRRGVAVTEFAIVAPVFFLMIVGFIEFARALMVQQVLVNAARVGAREAILASGATTQSVTDAVNDYTEGITVHPVTVNVSSNPATAEAGDMITVTASVNYIDVSWMPAPWFLGDAVLTSSATMRKEGFD